MANSSDFSFDPDLPIICITCYGRSGSFLLQSLLENHPQLMVMPAHAFVVPAARNDLIKYMIDYLKGRPVSEIVDDVVFLLPYIFRETDQTPQLRAAASRSKIGVPQEQFRAVLANILSHELMRPDEPGMFFRAIHYAYHICLGRELSEVVAIIWQRHSPFPTDHDKFWLVNTLRNVKFLVPVRRPEVTINSHFSAKNFGGPEPSTMNDVPIILIQALWGGRVHKDLRNRSAAVRFEDMHSKPERVTMSIAKWIGIQWHPNMLELSIDGGEMLFPKGDSFVRGLNPDIEKQQGAKYFTWLDKLIINAVSAQSYKQWGYETEELKVWTSWFLRKVAIVIPFKMEFMLLRNELRSGKGLVVALKRAAIRRKEVCHVLSEFWLLNNDKTEYRILDVLDD